MTIDTKLITPRPLPVAPKVESPATPAAQNTVSSAGTAPTKDSFQTGHVHGASCGCGKPKVTGDELAKVEAKVADKVAEIQANKADGSTSLTPVEPKVIDVYFHVITKGAGPKNGDVSQEQIEAQIKVLNDAYKDAGFQFNLVEVDRTKNAKWYTGQPGTSAETDMKSTLRKGDSEALNIYSTSPSGGLLGWATFPSDYKDFPKDDGVVILNTSLPGGTSAPYNEGDTATHEVGHWMGLHHTFNQPGLPDNDSVSDTPEHEVNYGKPPETTDTVPGKPGNDPVHNYMNYTDDDWMYEFTPGQVDRMQAQWELFRETSPSSTELLAA
ncbi:MAG: zinc metalloprotease [Myxococcota bacterium]|nr:zinc metalloprotease [Myxococcota bacterium]